MLDQYFLTAVDFTGNRMGASGSAPIIPATPTSLTAVADSDSIVLNWTEHGTYDTVAIDRKTTGNYTALTTISGGIATYDDTTAVVGTTYTYQVRGTRNGYPSAYSNSASDTIPAVTLKAAQNAAATGNWLDAGNAAGLKVIGTDTIIFGGWVKWNDSIASTLLTKGDVDGGTESYGLQIKDNTGILQFFINDSVEYSLETTDAVVSGTKSFILVWLTPTAINITIDGGTAANRAAVRTNIADPGGNVIMFANDDGAGGLGMKGIMDEWFFCKNPGNLANALSLINTTIYNSGSGNHYAALTAGNITTLGLVSWWGLDEASGATRKDLNSTNDFTLHGTITQVAPLTV